MKQFVQEQGHEKDKTKPLRESGAGNGRGHATRGHLQKDNLHAESETALRREGSDNKQSSVACD